MYIYTRLFSTFLGRICTHRSPSVPQTVCRLRFCVYARLLQQLLFCLCFCSPMLSHVFSTLSTARFCSFYTQLRLTLFLYWSSLLLFNKVLITTDKQVHVYTVI